MKQVSIRKERIPALQRRHPWIFSGALWKVDPELQDGDIVQVIGAKQEVLAVGHYHLGSIAVRVLSFEDIVLDQAFFEQRLDNCLRLRRSLGLPNDQTNCFRLVHGEGDGLPGLVVDVYGQTAVVQCHSIGMYRQLDLICKAILKVCDPIVKSIYVKSKESLPPKYASDVENAFYGEAGETGQVIENGHLFRVNPATGQKTGFFIDQRDNRRLTETLARGKRVLNAYCYTGGFSVYALQGGAESVLSIDISATAMEMLEENIRINGLEGKHSSVTGDVLKYLTATEEQFDLAIIDPPAFAKTMEKRHNAVQGYKRLNILALARVAPGGIMLTFSCSQVIDRQLFYDTITAAAIESGRNVRVIGHMGQPGDHPVSLFHPEGSYLKGLVLAVD